MTDKTKEKLIYAIVAAAIIPGGIILLGGLTLFNTFYKELKKEKQKKDAIKTDCK